MKGHSLSGLLLVRGCTDGGGVFTTDGRAGAVAASFPSAPAG